MIWSGLIKRILAVSAASLFLSVLCMGHSGCVSRLKPIAPPAPLPPATEQRPVPPAVKPVLPAIQFTIQVGAFSTTDRAARYMETLQIEGLDAYYFIDADGLSKVRFERFDAREAAHERAMALRAQGVIQDYFIARPRTGGGTPRTPAVNPRIALEEKLVITARRFIGTPYRWGGSSQRDGFDCSGLTMTVYRLNGLDLPRSSRAQYRTGTPVARNELRRGDLVFFATNGGKTISHVGIYSGQGRFIHAPGRGKHIRSASMSTAYFRSRYKGARRYY